MEKEGCQKTTFGFVGWRQGQKHMGKSITNLLWWHTDCYSTHGLCCAGHCWHTRGHHHRFHCGGA
eukprot:6828075-Prorocentrum_lima.AAC.1